MIKKGIDIYVEEQPESRRTRTSRKLKERGITAKDEKASQSSSSTALRSKKVLMVEVENIVHEKFKNTEEVKVIFFVILVIKISKIRFIFVGNYVTYIILYRVSSFLEYL